MRVAKARVPALAARVTLRTMLAARASMTLPAAAFTVSLFETWSSEADKMTVATDQSAEFQCTPAEYMRQIADTVTAGAPKR